MIDKDIYIKKIGIRGHIDIWLVDGTKIRRDLDEEFTNFGHHYFFEFIPENEFWIDREHKKGEIRYFVDHMLIEHRLISEGKDFEYAEERANRVEKRERAKSKLVSTISKEQKNGAEIIDKIHKELLKEYSKNLKVWIVSGELIRDLFCVDFTEGGHDRVYPFVPKNEIWLDDDLEPKERKFVLLHELHERSLIPEGHNLKMKNGIIEADKNYNKIYTSAHIKASRLEYYCRHHPNKLDKKLKKEIEKS
ncbi:MAG: hypothetical protein A2V60_00140 [Candidatus Portnoybacteria bacterium RIFCSPHIGHO2_01_FULL_39_19]|nr:MAG: hypothetical protein A2V60_00140 [Candidatus Portnoybacteria bacterium RIFCSPHIGHO2_01_FULL_39_19]